MAHSIFGWSYPPGCSGPPDQDDPPEQIALRSYKAGFNHDCAHCNSPIVKGQEHLYGVYKDVDGHFFTQRFHRYCPQDLEPFAPEVDFPPDRLY